MVDFILLKALSEVVLVGVDFLLGIYVAKERSLSARLTRVLPRIVAGPPAALLV